MPRPIHFEIHADDPARARTFYESMFGWTFSQWGGQEYWLIKTGEPGQPGIDGGMIRRMGPPPTKGQPVNAYVCTVDVANLDASVAKATSSGGTIAVPRMGVPGIGWLAYVTDTEGNIVGMMENDPAAK
jgi:predicted enzyme related to lactoylglutathione lyase